MARLRGERDVQVGPHRSCNASFQKDSYGGSTRVCAWFSEKTERAAPGPAVVGSPGTIPDDPNPGRPPRENGARACPICGAPLTGRQASACSDNCWAAAWQALRRRELSLALEELGWVTRRLERICQRDEHS